MNYTFRKADDSPLDDVVKILNRGYSDYVVPVEFTRETLLRSLEADDVDLEKSLILTVSEKPIGIALLAVRGAERRLAGMCVDPDYRRRRLGESLLRAVLLQAQEEGVSRVWLEVIDQNAPAFELYRKSGFQVRRRLVGFRGRIDGHSAPLQSDSSSDLADAIRRSGLPDLPWQISAETIERLAASDSSATSFWRLNSARAAVTYEEDARVLTLRALVVAPEARRQKQAAELLKGMSSLFDRAEFRVPAFFPEEQFAPFFTTAELLRQEITQHQMVREFQIQKTTAAQR